MSLGGNTGRLKISSDAGRGEGLDGILADMQDEVMEGDHLHPSPVQQSMAGIPDSLGR